MHRKAINHLRRSDPVIAAVIDRVGRCAFAPRSEGTHFDAVARAIVYQQLSGSAAFTIYSRLLALNGGTPPSPEQVLAFSDEALRGIGLSRQKISYVKDLARRVEEGDVPIHTLDALSDDEIIAALTRVKGIGTWTAQMFLMFRLGRPDVLPVLDLGIRKAMQKAYRMRRLPSEARMRKIAAAWTPYSTIACWYLWRSLDAEQKDGRMASKRQGGAGRVRANGG
jgi:DNA-3-methyladenine glycosylase II